MLSSQCQKYSLRGATSFYCYPYHNARNKNKWRKKLQIKTTLFYSAREIKIYNTGINHYSRITKRRIWQFIRLIYVTIMWVLVTYFQENIH